MVQWGDRLEAEAEDKGHSPVQFGHSDTLRSFNGSRKGYVRCECGVILSSKVDSLASFRRHQSRQIKGK
jgi:hypothetical protein